MKPSILILAAALLTGLGCETTGPKLPPEPRYPKMTRSTLFQRETMSVFHSETPK